MRWRDNKVLHPFYLVLSYSKNVLIRKACFELRRVFYPDKRMDKWKEYKDRYAGKRCFIIATGPSLTLEDVQKLKNEYTFGMNSVCMLFDKLGWETTFYGIQDYNVYEKFKCDIQSFKTAKVFIGDNIEKKCGHKLPFQPFYVDYLNHRYTYDKLSVKFSTDITKRVYDGYTITYSLMQIAAYMGFSEIYLLGNDCSYAEDPKKQHFADFGHFDPTAVEATRRILYAYQEAKQIADKGSFIIYNSTRGGKLEIFKRVALEDVLKN